MSFVLKHSPSTRVGLSLGLKLLKQQLGSIWIPCQIVSLPKAQCFVNPSSRGRKFYWLYLRNSSSVSTCFLIFWLNIFSSHEGLWNGLEVALGTWVGGWELWPGIVTNLQAQLVTCDGPERKCFYLAYVHSSAKGWALCSYTHTHWSC